MSLRINPRFALAVCVLLCGWLAADGGDGLAGTGDLSAWQVLKPGSGWPSNRFGGFSPYPTFIQGQSARRPTIGSQQCSGASVCSIPAEQTKHPTDQQPSSMAAGAQVPFEPAAEVQQLLEPGTAASQEPQKQHQQQQDASLQQQQQQQPTQELQQQQQQQQQQQPPSALEVAQQQQPAAAPAEQTPPAAHQQVPAALTATTAVTPTPPAAVTPTPSKLQPAHPSTVRRLLNLAALNDGASVLAANPEAKKPDRAIDKDIDSFMKNDCNADKWLIIELSQLGTVETVKLTMKELYSSRVHTFRVFGRLSHPRKDGPDLTASLGSDAWQLLGSFTAENKRGTQSFSLPQRSRVRYLLLMFDTHYGSEAMCALNWVEVLGVSAAQELEEALALQELESEVEDHHEHLYTQLQLEQQQQQQHSVQQFHQQLPPVAQQQAQLQPVQQLQPTPTAAPGAGSVDAGGAQTDSGAANAAAAMVPAGTGTSEQQQQPQQQQVAAEPTQLQVAPQQEPQLQQQPAQPVQQQTTEASSSGQTEQQGAAAVGQQDSGTLSETAAGPDANALEGSTVAPAGTATKGMGQPQQQPADAAVLGSDSSSNIAAEAAVRQQQKQDTNTAPPAGFAAQEGASELQQQQQQQTVTAPEAKAVGGSDGSSQQGTQHSLEAGTVQSASTAVDAFGLLPGDSGVSAANAAALPEGSTTEQKIPDLSAAAGVETIPPLQQGAGSAGSAPAAEQQSSAAAGVGSVSNGGDATAVAGTPVGPGAAGSFVGLAAAAAGADGVPGSAAPAAGGTPAAVSTPAVATPASGQQQHAAAAAAAVNPHLQPAAASLPAQEQPVQQQHLQPVQQQQQHVQQQQPVPPQREREPSSALDSWGAATKPKQAGNLFDVIKSEMMQLKLDQSKVSKKLDSLGKRSTEFEALATLLQQQQAQVLVQLENLTARLERLAEQQEKLEMLQEFQFGKYPGPPGPGPVTAGPAGLHHTHPHMPHPQVQAGASGSSAHQHGMPGAGIPVCHSHIGQSQPLLQPRYQWGAVVWLGLTTVLGLCVLLHPSGLQLPAAYRLAVCVLAVLNGVLAAVLGVWLLVLQFMLIGPDSVQVASESQLLVVPTYRMLGSGSGSVWEQQQ